ncbi:MAG: hypothetical protein A2Y97_13440 [Nitrospirae bacterium RBG_13_39_12]|nr:MAG: hypothetical protein A2Y97_13440 [Nitrospirae bacterium RBG_13_39_12]
MTEPLVSVKMITYNHAPYIARAIEGVLQQKTNFPFELIIGEDCSTDGTREIVFGYQEKYPDIIRVVTSDKNVGMKKNGYRTVKACRGKYVAFCEGDDFWHHPLKVQKQADYMESHPECGMVHSDYDVHHVASGRVIKNYMKDRKFEVPIRPNICDIVESCRVSFRIQTCTVMVRRALSEQIIESDPYLYLAGHFLMGDTQLWAELSLFAEIAYIPESLATYCLLGNSASGNKDKTRLWRFEKSHSEMLLYLCDKHGLPESIRKKNELSWCDSSLRLAFYEKNASLASEVRKKKNAFRWKEWLRYYGARNVVLRCFVRGGGLLFDVFRKEVIN